MNPHVTEMRLGELADRELIILKEMKRQVLHWAPPKTKEKVKQAKIRLAKAKEELAKDEKELKDVTQNGRKYM